MIRLLRDLGILPCAHRDISWPQGRGRNVHIQCHDCKRTLSYDWEQMAIGPEIRDAAPAKTWRRVEETTA